MLLLHICTCFRRSEKRVAGRRSIRRAARGVGLKRRNSTRQLPQNSHKEEGKMTGGGSGRISGELRLPTEVRDWSGSDAGELALGGVVAE